MSGSSTDKINVYARYAYKCLRANLDDWIEFRNCPDTQRSITHGFYNSVHSLTIPSGLISRKALDKKLETIEEGIKWEPCKDHCYSPQFVSRMILDNADLYLSHPWSSTDEILPNQQKFIEIFLTCCTTIQVTPEENQELSNLTKNNRGKEYSIKIPTDKKYQHLNIELLKRHEGNGWYNKPTDPVSNYIQTPQELLDYEKQFLTE